MLTFLTGLFASMAHVVTGPDHLAAVTPLAIDSRKKSWFIGFSWGLGHTIGMLLLGLLFLLFKKFLPVEAISKHSDAVIGFLLILIGIWALVRTYRRHNHRNWPQARVQPAKVKRNALTSFSIGIIHGFAGFSHLIALLPSLALPSIYASVVYIAAFATGTIMTMIIFAFIVGQVAFQSFVKEKQRFLKWFTYSGAFLAIFIGVLWLIKSI